jgi:hypothetical protein
MYCLCKTWIEIIMLLLYINMRQLSEWRSHLHRANLNMVHNFWKKINKSFFGLWWLQMGDNPLAPCSHQKKLRFIFSYMLLPSRHFIYGIHPTIIIQASMLDPGSTLVTSKHNSPIALAIHYDAILQVRQAKHDYGSSLPCYIAIGSVRNSSFTAARSTVPYFKQVPFTFHLGWRLESSDSVASLFVMKCINPIVAN